MRIELKLFANRKSRLFASFISLIIILSACSEVEGINAETRHNYLILEDDFEEQYLERWEFWATEEASEPLSSSIYYDNGNNVLKMEGNIHGFVGDLDWGDYTIETKIKFIEGLGEAHINCRMGQIAPRYFIRISEEKITLTKEYKEKFIDLRSVEYKREENKWYNIKLSCEGNQLWIYLNDELQFTHVDEDEPLFTGRAGIESDLNTVIYFDDFRVYTSHQYYVSTLIEEANKAINEARKLNADTLKAEETLEKARNKLNEGDYMGAETMANKALTQTVEAKIEKLEQKDPQPVDQHSFTWSIELIAGVVSIGAAGIGLIGWVIRTRNTRRRGHILFNKLMNEIDDVYTSFKMNANRCETELLKLKGEVLAGYKEGVLEEDSLHNLEGRIESYLKEVRKEIEKGDNKL